MSQSMDYTDQDVSDEEKGLKGHFLEAGWDLNMWR